MSCVYPRKEESWEEAMLADGRWDDGALVLDRK
jgi:hypothetical protein